MERSRRYYEDDYKFALVCLVVNQGYTVPHVSRIFNVNENVIRRWIKSTTDKLLIPRISLEQSQQQLETIERLIQQVANLRNENEELQKTVGQLYIKVSKHTAEL